MSNVGVRPPVAGSRWLEVVVGERVLAFFKDESFAERFAQQLARSKGIQLQDGPALAKSRPGGGTYALGADVVIQHIA